MHFRPNDRILFLGDSITQQHLWTLYLENWLLWQEPSLVIRNRGWGGNQAPAGVERFHRDVAPLRPTWVFIAFGMNDGGYQPVSETLLRIYRESLTELVRLTRSIGAEPILCSTTAVDEAVNPTLLKGYNETLRAFTDACRSVAEEHGALFLDLFFPLPGLVPDGVHPGPDGHRLVARAAAEQLGLPEGPAISYSHDPVPGRHTVSIDGEPAGNFSREDLQAGVRLTGGGLKARAQTVMALSQSIWQYDRAAWREYGPLGITGSRSPAAADSCASAVRALEEERHRLLTKPVTIETRPEEPVTLQWELSGPHLLGPGADLYDGLHQEPSLPWQPVASSADDHVDLVEVYGPVTQAVAFARASFTAPFDGDLHLSLGSDDGYKLYLDGEMVAGLPVMRGSAPGQEQYLVPVTAGPHTVMLRIHQGIGAWDFYATAHLRPTPKG